MYRDRWSLLLAFSTGFAGLLVVNANLLDIDKILIQIPLFFAMSIAAYVILRYVDVRSMVAYVSRKWQWTAVVYLSIYSIYIAVLQYSRYFYANYPEEVTRIFYLKMGLISLLGLFATITAWRLFFWGVATLYRKLAFTKIEKWIIGIYTGFVTLVAIALPIFLTNNFVLKLGIVDTIYAMDSSALMRDEVYDNNLTGLNTDVRHPIAQSLTMPLGILSRVGGQLFHFVPYMQAHVLQMFMILMIGVTGVLLVRLLDVKRSYIQVATFAGYVFLYSTLIFTLAMEQYVPSVFFLVLFVYGFVNKWSFKWNVFSLVASAGYIITSAAAAMVFMLEKGKTLRKRVVSMFIAGGFFLLTTIASGKLLTLLFANRQLDGLSSFSGSLTFGEKINQFVNFIASTITVGYHTTFFDGSFWKYKTAGEALSQTNPVGLVVIVLVLLGLWAGRKKVVSWIAAGWIVFSFIICVVIGWGAAFNEMALYSFYFGWAYFVLCFMAVRWLIDLIPVKRAWRGGGLVVILAAVSIVNIVAFTDIIRFTGKNYPSAPFIDQVEGVLDKAEAQEHAR